MTAYQKYWKEMINVDAITELIKNLINKEIHKSTLISSVPCRVIESLGNEMYTVQLVTDNSQYTLPNMSGSSLSVGENVQLFYYGEYISSKSSYIGASLNKDSGGSAKYIISTNTTGEIGSGTKQISSLLLKALNDTTVSLSFNANILGSGSDNFILSVSVDGVDYDYQIKGTTIANKYIPCNFTLPITFDVGDHAVAISINGTGSVTDINAFICGHGIDDADVIIKEMTGVAPLAFSTIDSSLLDWRINGAAGGVGRTGKNYLRQTTAPIPNGAVGTFIEANTDGWFNGSQNIANGYSFNTKTAKRIVLVFAKSDESALSVSEVGDLMLVEGTTVPATYNADTNLYTKNIMWGGLYPHTYKPYPATYSEDDAQELYAGDNGYGAEVLYRLARSFWETRCKTYVIDVEPNTDYSVRLFGSSATLMAYIYLLDESGTVQQTFMGADMQGGGACAIPSCGEYNTDTEQWCRLDAIMATGYPSNNDVAVDARPNKYEFCESFAELEAGTYKLMVEVLGNHTWNGPYVGFTSYGGNIYDSFTPSDTYPPVGTYERFAVIAEDNTLIIPETNIFDSTTVRYSTSPPYPNFHHKEYTFTLTKKTKVGVIHRGYSNVHNYSGGDGDIQAYFRFMICDADVEAEEFESTNLYANISGESAWEKFQYILPVTISNDSEIQTVDIDLGDSPLEEGQSISLSDTQISMPTYIGNNTISVDSAIQPIVYIKYRDWEK